MRSGAFIFVNLFFLVLLLSCQASGYSPAPTSAPTIATPPTEIATSTPLPSPTQTETPIPSPTLVPEVRFAVIGDFGEAGPGLAAVADLIDSWDVDFIITTGDNNYPVGSPKTIDENIGQYFHAYISPYKGDYGEGAENNRFFPALGNHDWMWLDAQPYLDYFELPGDERYYSFSWDFVDFFAVDSEWAEPDGIGQDSLQAEWLKGTLAESTAAWKVVYFHLAPYTSGYNGPTTHMRWPFKEWGADVVLSGHDHHYERLVVDDLTYFVVGISGGPIYPIPALQPGSHFRYREMHGAMLVEASPDEIWFGFYNIEGELVDEWIIVR